MLDLSIIIVNYNSSKDLLQCLDSIRQTVKKIKYEVIIIDNNSIDQESLATAIGNYPMATLLACKKNHGFAAANNIGIRKATGSLLLLLNPDTLVLDNAIEKMYHFLSSRIDVAVVGPSVIKENGSLEPYCARRSPGIWTEVFYHTGLARLFPKSKIFGRYLMTYWDHTTQKEIELLTGSCMMVKKQSAKKVGYLNERFFLYGDDVEWCYRFRKAGYKIYFNPSARIVHKGGKSTRPQRSTTIIIAFDSMYKFIKFYHGLINSIIYRIVVFMIYFMKCIFRWVIPRESFFHHFNILLWAIGALKLDQDTYGRPIWRGIKKWQK